MSQKKKRKPAPVVARGSDGGTSVADAAEAALAAAHYKEAIEHFKALLKLERRAVWLDGLAAAYAGRAGQLAAKGMFKEALALWRTSSDACEQPLLDGPYVGWLVKTGQTAQALAHWAALDKPDPAARERARTQLAPAVLVAGDDLVAGLPEDMLSHRAAARAALAAGTTSDATALAQALQAVSYRSPYRDLRPLLKALALQATEPQQAAQALARVGEGGPFDALAAVLKVCLLPGTAWLAGLRQLDDAGRSLVLALKGCPASQRPLVLALMARAGDTATAPPALLELLLQHRQALPAGPARKLALRLLPHAPQRIDAVRAGFPPLAAAEQEQALALAAELKQRPDQAEAHWLRLVDLLAKAPAGQRRAALILRRLAGEHAHHSPDGSLCVHAQDWLAQSLQLDPADRATHLRLVRDARLHGDLRHARHLLDAARARFPDDAPLLLEAVEVALAGGAFKKAAGLAKQVLQADPINPRVRSVVGEAHLSHARKQIGAGQLQAAARELDAAAAWLRSTGERGRLKLLRGLAAEPAAAGDALLREAVAELGGPLVGGFHLLLEAKRIKGRPALQPKDLLRRAGVDGGFKPSAADVVALAQALHAVPEGDAAPRAALGALRGMLERAADRVPFSESEHLRVCEALHRHRQTELTCRFAAAARRRWPQRPVFVYLDAAARFGAAPWTMPEHEWHRLEQAFRLAHQQGDERTATRLGKLLDDAEPPDDSDFDTLDQAMDMLLAAGGEGPFLEMARRQLGQARFDLLRREIAGSDQQFARALAEMLAGAELPPPPPVRILPPPARKAKAPKTSPAGKPQPDLFDD